MYPDNFYSSTFTLLADAEVGKHFYWNLFGFLVHGQVLVVIWFVFALLLLFAFLGTSNTDRIPNGWQNFAEASVDFVTDIARDQLVKASIVSGYHLLLPCSSLSLAVTGQVL